VPLAAFRVRSFRFQWPADLLTSWAFEMETLILSWYVMVQTGSVLLLTVFGALQLLGTLAAPMFGALGDRIGGRAMLCAMRTCYAVMAAFVMSLGLAGALTPAWVLLVAALVGIVRPSDLVMRNSLIGETIPRAHLMGALGLSRATMDSARIAGALSGAALSDTLGIGLAYTVVTGCYLASLGLTLGVSRGRPVPDPGASPGTSPATIGAPRSSRWRDVRDVLLHVAASPAVLATMLLAFLVNLSAYPVSSGLLPYVARHVYGVDATGLGWLAASFPVGGLLGSIVMVATGGSRRPERSMLVHIALWYVALLGFAAAPSMRAGMLALALAGFVQSLGMIAMTATLLADAGDGFRGRIMGVRMLAVYGMPLGLLASGALIARIGYAPTVTLYCVVGLVLTVLIGIRWRASMWRRDARASSLAASAPQRVS
jgi:predicted MFS family arabinose efflux permease